MRCNFWLIWSKIVIVIFLPLSALQSFLCISSIIYYSSFAIYNRAIIWVSDPSTSLLDSIFSSLLKESGGNGGNDSDFVDIIDGIFPGIFA